MNTFSKVVHSSFLLFGLVHAGLNKAQIDQIISGNVAYNKLSRDVRNNLPPLLKGNAWRNAKDSAKREALLAMLETKPKKQEITRAPTGEIFALTREDYERIRAKHKHFEPDMAGPARSGSPPSVPGAAKTPSPNGTTTSYGRGPETEEEFPLPKEDRSVPSNPLKYNTTQDTMDRIMKDAMDKCEEELTEWKRKIRKLETDILDEARELRLRKRIVKIRKLVFGYNKHFGMSRDELDDLTKACISFASPFKVSYYNASKFLAGALNLVADQEYKAWTNERQQEAVKKNNAMEWSAVGQNVEKAAPGFVHPGIYRR